VGTGKEEDEVGAQPLVSGREPPLGARVGTGEWDVEKVVSGFQSLVSGREPGLGAPIEGKGEGEDEDEDEEGDGGMLVAS
jgi:hypothetical protein